MADTKRQKIEKRINAIVARGKKRGTPQATIDRETKLYRTQLAKLPTRVSPAPGKPKPIIKPKEKSKNKESKEFSFFTPKGRKQLDSIISKVMKAIGPDKKPTTQDVKKALPTNQNDMSNKSIEEIRNIIKKAESEGNKLQTKRRQNTPVVAKKVPVVAKKVPVVAKKVPDYTPKGNKAMLKKKDSDVKFTKRIEKAIKTPVNAGPARSVAEAQRRGLSTFTNKAGKKLAAVTKEQLKDAGFKNTKKGLGKFIKQGRELDAIDNPNKKKSGGKVFRRGGGQALRGFGKATYSNKMY